MSGGASETVIFNAPLADCIAVITDYEKYPDYIANMLEAKVVAKTDEYIDVYYKISVSIKNVDYTLRHFNDTNGIRWKETEHGPFASNTGGWELKDIGNGQVEAKYTVDISLNIWMPGFVKDWLIGKGLPATLASFKKRIEDYSQGNK
jgi:ribosome-associated toxin RatA of RatAB toxin-antitoxin module